MVYKILQAAYLVAHQTIMIGLEATHHSNGFARAIDNVSRMCYIAFYGGISLKEN